MALITILNGPNLNLIGTRQPEIYGRETLADVEKKCAALAGSLGHEIKLYQSNAEHDLVNWIQEARGEAGAIIINPAAYSHTSVAIYDALLAFEGPVIEVHISNIHAREEFRHHSYVSLRAEGVIAGCGMQGYELAVQRVANLLAG